MSWYASTHILVLARSVMVRSVCSCLKWKDQFSLLDDKRMDYDNGELILFWTLLTGKTLLTWRLSLSYESVMPGWKFFLTQTESFYCFVTETPRELYTSDTCQVIETQPRPCFARTSAFDSCLGWDFVNTDREDRWPPHSLSPTLSGAGLGTRLWVSPISGEVWLPINVAENTIMFVLITSTHSSLSMASWTGVWKPTIIVTVIWGKIFFLLIYFVFDLLFNYTTGFYFFFVRLGT